MDPLARIVTWPPVAIRAAPTSSEQLAVVAPKPLVALTAPTMPMEASSHIEMGADQATAPWKRMLRDSDIATGESMVVVDPAPTVASPEPRISPADQLSVPASTRPAPL